MHKHAKMIDELTKEFGGQRPLAEALSEVAQERITFRGVSRWKKEGVSYRFRGAFARLCSRHNINYPEYFHIHD